ncbi:MAG: ABC transporter permease subunit [Alphaproteobacteria bacterium]|nr:ABC transporter permease subunit [Alphaproteobacteria bacterium]
MGIVLEWLDAFAWGAVVVLRVFVVALIFTVIWGLIGATAKLSANPVARGIANAYTTVLRGTPELLVLLIVYFGSAVTLTSIAKMADPTVKFVHIPPFWAGSLAISFIVGAYATETFRGAFLGVDRGQVEAARALGLTPAQTFFYVRLPQMWRLALPAFGNHMNSLIKDTALLSVIGVEEIMYAAARATAVTNKPFTMYLVVAIIYLVFVSVIIKVVAVLEVYANRHLERTP